jgi:hypothetical protein
LATGKSYHKDQGLGLQERLEASLEEAQAFRFVNHAQAVDPFPLLEQGDAALGDHIHVEVRVDAARNGEAHEFWTAVVVGLGVAAGADDAALHGAHAAVHIEGRGEALGGELVLRQVGEEGLGVEEDGVAAEGLHGGHTRLLQLQSEVGHLVHAGGDVGVLHHLADAHGHGFEVAAREASVGRHALEDDEEFPRPPREIGVVRGQEAADVDEVVLLAADSAAFAIGHPLPEDRCHAARGIALFAALDEEGVSHGAGGVEDDRQAVPLRPGAHFAQVRHGEGLAARHVHAGARLR